ncbi:MAG: UDP-N-acetylmuramoyl-L-alanine--D-glutamate ligase [Actinomycetota bacterium]
MSGFRGKRVTIVGLGESGLAAARVLLSEGASVVISEESETRDIAERAAAAQEAGADVRPGGHAPGHLNDADLVVVSPGVPQGADVILWANARRIPVWSELELGARLARCPYIAVTGTNGKTTTTRLIAEAMRRSGLDAIACGNIGYPFSLAAAEGHDALAVEASSFQLRFHETFHPKVSALLNIAEDHIDWHGSPDEYVAAKRLIYVRQDADDVHVGNRDDEAAAAISGDAPCPVVWFTGGPPVVGEAGYEDHELVWRDAAGGHSLGRPLSDSASHRANAAAAAASSISFGIDPEAVGAAIRETAPPPHRGETVAEVAGIRFVDDSKATNPHAALSTIRGFRGAILICGGRSKGIDLRPMAQAIPHLAATILLGEAARDLERVFGDRIPTRRAGSIEEAVQLAFEMAKPGTAVVLAPGCSSWDMFRDYAERGERFTRAAQALDGKRVSHA